MNGQYEVLNPWAEADPIPLRGISPRVTELKDKTIGLLFSTKRAARPILTVVQEKLKERFPTLKFIWFPFDWYLDIAETKDKARLDKFIKEVEVVISSVGD